MLSKFTIGVNTSMYIQYDLLTALDHIATAGFEYVELAAVDGALEHLHQEDLTPANAKVIRQALHARGLTSNAFAAHINLTEPDAYERFLRRLEFTADIGTPVCITGCGPEEKKDVCRRNLELLVKKAQELKVIIALETNADMIKTGASGSAFVKEFDSPWLGVNYDAANVLRGTDGKADIVSDFRSVLQELKHIHLKDIARDGDELKFCLPGTGLVDTEGFFKVLRERREPVGLNIELPYQYRLADFSAPIRVLEGKPTLQEIDTDLMAVLKTIKNNLR